MEKSEELRDFVLLYCQAITSGDTGFIERHMSRLNGLLVIGIDPHEWWTGYAATIEPYARQGLKSPVGVTLAASDPQAHREGSVGWAADRVRIRLPDGTEIPCRLTLVWHLEDGEWKIVQHHLSIGVENEQASTAQGAGL
jgi:hypothetical protein